MVRVDRPAAEMDKLRLKSEAPSLAEAERVLVHETGQIVLLAMILSHYSVPLMLASDFKAASLAILIASRSFSIDSTCRCFAVS